jgi:hypothetical protein
MDITCKIRDIRTWEKDVYVFLDISSTNTDNACPIALPVRLNPQHRSLLSLISVTSSSAKCLPPSCEPLYATNRSHREQNIFLYEYSLKCVLLPTKKRTTERCVSIIHSIAVAILTTDTILRTCACASGT